MHYNKEILEENVANIIENILKIRLQYFMQDYVIYFLFDLTVTK